MSKRIPKYTLHRPSGQARVRLDGKDYYLGTYGTPESREKYALLVAAHARGEAATPLPRTCKPALTVRTVLEAYLEHAGGYYRKGGAVTDQLCVIESAFRPVLGRHGATPAESFGPRALKECRQDMVGRGWCRNYVNKAVGCVVRAWAWAVTEELVGGESAQALREVPSLRPGEGGVRESEPRGPVPPGDFEAALPCLPAAVADLLRVQYLAGMRPVEVCHLAVESLDLTGQVPGGPQFPGVWTYCVPAAGNKNAHRGKERVVFLGPEAQRLLAPYLADAPEGRLFRRPDGRRWTARLLYKEIHRACRAAGVAPFSANQLRHARATDLNRRGALEDAQRVLGHAAPETTARYARASLELRALERAAATMRQVG